MYFEEVYYESDTCTFDENRVLTRVLRQAYFRKSCRKSVI